MINAGGALKKLLADETAKMNGMTLKEKVEYIWQYYKPALIAAAAALFLFVFLIASLINPRGKPYVYIAWTGSVQSAASLETLAAHLSVALGVPREKDYAVIEMFMPGGSPMQDNKMMILNSMIRAGEIDLIIAGAADLQSLADNGYLLDLSGIFPNIDPDFPFAVSIMSSRAVFDSGINAADRYAAVLAGSKRADRAAETIRALFGHKIN
ncbi:MAG: hypothetical protein FWE82_00075 [Defluviitaleaceae bacterium]|nr:hypothetical protein [Defluviitaleaceae bacterium]